MGKRERVVENLNRSLHALFAKDDHVFLIGEDILDPYGGAFKVSRGLSSNYPDRVLTTPISEESILGLAGGLAICGEKPIVEIMFGDFITLGFDQILNFATKSVSMYGRKIGMNMLVRCPIGGNRAYGPTHSQSLQKHFIGIPNLYLFELSPFHDNLQLIEKLVNLGKPCILFEDKVLYTLYMYVDGDVDDLFTFDFLDPERNFVRVSLKDFDEDEYDCLLIAPGGLVSRCLAAARKLFIDFEIMVQMIVPSRLYPFQIDPILKQLTHAKHIFIAEESVSGGTWGAEVASIVYDTLWGKLKDRIHLIHTKNSVIPASPHLEDYIIVQERDIYRAIKEAAYASNHYSQNQ